MRPRTLARFERAVRLSSSHSHREIHRTIGTEEEVVGQMAAEVFAIGESVENDVRCLWPVFSSRQSKSPPLRNGYAENLNPVSGVSERCFVAPKVGDAIVLVIALAGLDLLPKRALFWRRIECTEEEVLQIVR